MAQQFPLPIFDDFEPLEPNAIAVSEENRAVYEANGLMERYQARYHLLIARGYPWRVAAYISWMCCPSDLRPQKTLQAFANSIGLRGTRVIYDWREKYPDIEQEIAAFSAYLIGEEVAEVVGAMLQVATTPEAKGFNDRRMALTMAGVYDPSREQPSTVIQNAIARKSDDELARLAGDE